MRVVIAGIFIYLSVCCLFVQTQMCGNSQKRTKRQYNGSTLSPFSLIIHQLYQDMKKINQNSPFANTYIYMYVAAATLVYVLTLFALNSKFKNLLNMTYDKEARTIAGHDYVREVTRWPGHVHVLNIPVEYVLEQYHVHYQSVHISLKQFKLFMWSNTTIENKGFLEKLIIKRG